MSLQVTAPYYVTEGETTPSTLVRRTPSDSQPSILRLQRAFCTAHAAAQHHEANASMLER